MQDPTDPLSSLGRKLLKLDANAYAELLPKSAGNPAARDLLESTQPGDLVAGKVARADDARAMLSGLWLYFDFLDESHTISQSLENPTGSFWHAIMHRREGDFSNSKYWYARCQAHPSLAVMAAQASRVINQMPADKSLLRLIATGWNPNGFVDLVQAVHDSPDDPRHPLTVALQRLEWQVLFDHCTRSAAGR
ncbi:MAG: hypothetical protein QOF78_4370 [Phycisphaerales bacterium]|jgi:hypothetical protein|nr:hypothetical protein [Phycisphaerales bacterium]